MEKRQMMRMAVSAANEFLYQHDDNNDNDNDSNDSNNYGYEYFSRGNSNPVSSSRQTGNDNYYEYDPYESRQPPQPQYPYPWYYKILTWMEIISRPKVSILVTFLAVAYFYYQDSIHGWLDFYFPPHIPWTESLQALFWQGADWLRGNFYRFVELTRTLRHWSYGNGGGGGGGPNDAHGASVAARMMMQGQIMMMNRGGQHAARGLASAQQQQYFTLPELERLVDDTPQQQTAAEDALNPDACAAVDATRYGGPQTSLSEQQPLPPAFEHEEEYPEGWMVYHAVLGVVPKKEADAYDKDDDNHHDHDHFDSQQHSHHDTTLDRGYSHGQSVSLATLPTEQGEPDELVLTNTMDATVLEKSPGHQNHTPDAAEKNMPSSKVLSDTKSAKKRAPSPPESSLRQPAAESSNSRSKNCVSAADKGVNADVNAFDGQATSNTTNNKKVTASTSSTSLGNTTNNSIQPALPSIAANG